MKMRMLVGLLLMGMLQSGASATAVHARFIYDDSTPVAGTVSVSSVDSNTNAEALLASVPLDAQGRAAADLTIDPTLQLRMRILGASGTLLTQLDWPGMILPTDAAQAQTVMAGALQSLAILPTGELSFKLKKADGSLVALPAFTLFQTKQTVNLSSCALSGSAKLGTQGAEGATWGFVVAGAKWSCPIAVAAGSYTLTMRVASPYPRQIHFEDATGKVIATMAIPATGASWATFVGFSVTAALPAGASKLTVVADTGAENFDDALLISAN